MINLENLQYDNKTDELENKYFLERKKIIKEILIKGINEGKGFNITSDEIQRYDDFTGDYYIGINSDNILIKDVMPLVNLKINILEEAILIEKSLILEKIKKLENDKSSLELENINDKEKDNIDRMEYGLKLIYNILNKGEEKYKISELPYHEVFSNKLGLIDFENKKRNKIIDDFFIDYCDILEYEGFIFNGLFSIKDYLTNLKKFEQKEINNFLEGEYFPITAPVVSTLEYLKEALKNELEFDDGDEIKELKEQIKFIENRNYGIYNDDILYSFIKDKTSLSDLENVIIEGIIKYYELDEKEIEKIKKSPVEINITFGNYKGNF